MGTRSVGACRAFDDCAAAASLVSPLGTPVPLSPTSVPCMQVLTTARYPTFPTGTPVPRRRASAALSSAGDAGGGPLPETDRVGALEGRRRCRCGALASVGQRGGDRAGPPRAAYAAPLAARLGAAAECRAAMAGQASPLQPGRRYGDGAARVEALLRVRGSNAAGRGALWAARRAASRPPALASAARLGTGTRPSSSPGTIARSIRRVTRVVADALGLGVTTPVGPRATVCCCQ